MGFIKGFFKGILNTILQIGTGLGTIAAILLFIAFTIALVFGTLWVLGKFFPFIPNFIVLLVALAIFAAYVYFVVKLGWRLLQRYI